MSYCGPKLLHQEELHLLLAKIKFESYRSLLTIQEIGLGNAWCISIYSLHMHVLHAKVYIHIF